MVACLFACLLATCGFIQRSWLKEKPTASVGDEVTQLSLKKTSLIMAIMANNFLYITKANSGAYVIPIRFLQLFESYLPLLAQSLALQLCCSDSIRLFTSEDFQFLA